MEKLSREEMLTKKLLKEAGLEKPSLDFSANVIKAINAKRVVVEYKPLISLQGRIIIFSLLIISMAGFYFINSDLQISLEFKFFKALSLPSIPTIEVSKTMSYAIGFVSLFLLQIPFLKGLMERQMRP